MRKIPLGRPYLNTENILDEVKQVLDTKWISGGPTIAKFEDAIQSYNGGGYPVAVANGTIAIDMALLYLNDGKRYSEWDEVIVPSWSWVATGFSPINVGASPVWCDVNFQGQFTHFIERLNDPRNEAPIYMDELRDFFEDLANEYGDRIASQLKQNRPSGVGSDYQFDIPIHMPFMLVWNSMNRPT